MAVIARQLGHADTRMTEKHYAHLAPNYVADTIRQGFPRLAREERVVVPINQRRTATPSTYRSGAQDIYAAHLDRPFSRPIETAKP